MKNKIPLLCFCVAAAATFASSSQAAVRCEWLFHSVTKERVENSPNPAVLPSEARGANTKAWLQDSFFDVLEHFPFFSRYHSPRFLALDRSLMHAGFVRGRTEVREIEKGSFEVRVLYSNPHPTIADRTMTVESKIYFFTGDLMASRDGGPVLWEQNFVYRVVGITNSKTDVARRERGRRETHTRFYQQFRQAGFYDPKQSHPWTDHMRDVLDTILVPLALGSRDVAEVGIGLDPEAHLDSQGRSNQTPRLFLTRMRGYFEPRTISSQLLDLNSGQTEFDGVRAVETFADEATADLVYIPNRSQYLIVFDELLDRNPNGSIYAIDRATGERRALYYRPRSGLWTFEKPEPGEAPPAPKARVYDSSKVNHRLSQRIEALSKGGGNPRVKVVVRRIGIAGGTRSVIVSVREAARISLEADVESVTENTF